MAHFESMYEAQLHALKAEFHAIAAQPLRSGVGGESDALAPADADTRWRHYEAHLGALRAAAPAQSAQFDVRGISSLFALPTCQLDAAERILHRIWLGSAPPALVNAAIRQWGEALRVVAVDGEPTYLQVLWVWDATQLQHDVRFHATERGGGYVIGEYWLDELRLQVRSLRHFAVDTAGDLFALFDALLAECYWVNVSDFFRLVLLYRFGGIYLDADTLPYRTATLFLAKPEVPNYLHHVRDVQTGAIRRYHVSWMNLHRDENGFLVAKRGDPAIEQLIAGMQAKLARLPSKVPNKQMGPAVAKAYANAVHDATYGIWRQAMGRTFVAHDALVHRCAIYVDGQTEAVIAGLNGIRLLVDAVSNEPRPLSRDEQASFDRTMQQLAARQWVLDDPLALETLADVLRLQEYPRMAYHSQLRSLVHNCHYYSFLSHDERLDRLNTLFGAYLTHKNAEQIGEGNFWHRPYRRSPVSYRGTHTVFDLDHPHGQLPIAFLPGRLVPEPYRNRMAQLLFATSYLEYCSFGNKLNLPMVDLQRRQNIDPYLAQLYGMFDQQHAFAGFFTAGTLAEFERAAVGSYYRDEMQAMDAAYDAFVAHHAQPSDLFVASLAIDEPSRGKGLFNTMLGEIKRLARQKGCQRIVLTTWENKGDALRIYLKKGFQVSSTFDYAQHLFFDRLHFLSYDLKSASAA